MPTNNPWEQLNKTTLESIKQSVIANTPQAIEDLESMLPALVKDSNFTSDLSNIVNQAAEYGTMWNIVVLMLPKAKDYNLLGKALWTALNDNTAESIKAAKALIHVNANPISPYIATLAKNNQKNTVMHLAVKNQQEEIIILLLNKNPNYLNQPANSVGLTPIKIAAQNNDWKTLKLLLNFVKKPHATDKANLNFALSFVVLKSEDPEAAELILPLLDAGAKITTQKFVKQPPHTYQASKAYLNNTIQERTILHIAAEVNNKNTYIELFKYKKGLNYDVLDSNRHSPLNSLTFQGKSIKTYNALMWQAEYYHLVKESLYWIYQSILSGKNEFATLLIKLPNVLLEQILDYIIHPATDFFEHDYQKIKSPIEDSKDIPTRGISVMKYHYQCYSGLYQRSKEQVTINKEHQQKIQQELERKKQESENHRKEIENSQEAIKAKNALKRTAIIMIYHALNPAEPVDHYNEMNDKELLSRFTDEVIAMSKHESSRHGEALRLATMYYQNCNPSNKDLVDAIYRSPGRKNQAYFFGISEERNKSDIRQALERSTPTLAHRKRQ